ncbi:ribosomal protein S5 domain 2-like protein [Athelia psychrophila]|uniref:Ribosomal RNA-processing protein 42 n=1 Tax=Athelia psychrophila TaxID=1759441 RepID=A0A166BAY1_9AGAM|nr:ribosomal protein S5 domain 2-like protein [Fibularhizoctonia sp. CBS 109695]
MATPLLSKSEKSYIHTALLDTPPQRADGRTPHAFRAIALETGVASAANGSARVQIGGVGGTEVMAAVKLEVGTDGDGEGEGIMCSVSCSSSAYPHLAPTALDDRSHDLTGPLQAALAALAPSAAASLSITKGKHWRAHVDAVVLADAGGAWEAVCMAVRAALCDTKVPRTKGVEYRTQTQANSGAKSDRNKGGEGGDMDVDTETRSGFDTRAQGQSENWHGRGGEGDFELVDYWDEGEVLKGKEGWPVGVVLNLLPPIHILDATLPEEAALPLQLLLAFSFPPSPSAPEVCAMRLLGSGADLDVKAIGELVKAGESYARTIYDSLNAKLASEEARRGVKARERFAAARAR